MSTAIYIIIAILIFGFLIAIHELGHFIAAKSTGVKVNEFAIGMGPAIFKRQKGETLYALRAFPIGGYCAMEGEDEDSSDPRSFTQKSVWKKLIILIAGSFMNLLAGFLLVILILSQESGFVMPVISNFLEGNTIEGEYGLLAGDRIVSINGERIYLANDINTFLSRGDSVYYDLVIERSGEKIALDHFKMEKQDFVIDGKTYSQKYGMNFEVQETGFFTVIQQSWYTASDFVRMVRLGLVDLVSGGVGVKDMSGPVGIVDTITQVGQNSPSTSAAIWNILYLGAFIAVNLAVMNMLPLPALDGGRIFFLFITAIVEKIRKKRLDPKYEGYIHMAGMVLLLCLMVYVTFNDITRLITR